MSSPASPAPAVALPKRAIANPPTAPLWAVSTAVDSEIEAPLPAKCDRHSSHRDGVCCKNLRGDDERTLVDPDVVRDIIIGLSDGLTVPFALTAGLSSIGNSRIVVIGGVAELIAGAISMGIGGFLASQAERDHFRYLRTQTRARVQRSCVGEMEREVHGVLGPVGVDEKLSRQVANSLLALEDEQMATIAAEARDRRLAGLDDERRSWWSGLLKIVSRGGSKGVDHESGGLRWSEDVGLTAFLLKFGEGLEEVPTARLYISAFTIGTSYFLGGLVPLLPYFFLANVHIALLYSCLVTGIILLIFGAVKTHVTGAAGGARGYIWGAVSTLAVGGAAAGAAFAIVRALEV